MGIRTAEHGPAVEYFVRERLEPAKQGGLLSTPAHARPCQLDQVRRPLEILGGQRVLDRIGRKTILFVPLARALMEDRYLIWLLRHQMRTENFGEEVMVTIPLASVIQRHNEEVAPLESLQHHSGVLLVGDGIAQRATQPVENGGLEQEIPDTFGLALQDLFDQIVQYVAVVSSESPDEPGNVLPPSHRERGQLQAGDPTFRADFQGGDLFLREVEAHRPLQKFGGFGEGKTQI